MLDSLAWSFTGIQTMSLDLANLLRSTLEVDPRTVELVGLGPDVQGAVAALRAVETAEDLFKIYKTDVPPGDLSVRNLLEVLRCRLQDVHNSTGFLRDKIAGVLSSPYVASLEQAMGDQAKGSTDIKLFNPTNTETHLNKAIKEFEEQMKNTTTKVKVENALKKGRGLRLQRLRLVCKPVTVNAKKAYTREQVNSAAALLKCMRSL